MAPRTVPSTRMWMRFLAPYYICNGVMLLMYVPIRYHHTSEALLQRENFLNLTLEQEIFLLALGSWLLNYRKKATVDGVIALFYMYGKIAILASLYYLDITLFGWYLVVCLVLFGAVGLPRYDGASNIVELNPATMEKLITKAVDSPSWLVFYYTDWSDSCVEHEPMLADLSLRYSSTSLQFGRVDVNKWPDLAVENQINVSTSSWQLPTLILFQSGKEMMRLPPIDENGKITKSVLDQASLIAAFKLQALKERKCVEWSPRTS
ncbi:putative Thioredoxin domain-containing protein [Plasmopara halstedii]